MAIIIVIIKGLNVSKLNKYMIDKIVLLPFETDEQGTSNVPYDEPRTDFFFLGI